MAMQNNIVEEVFPETLKILSDLIKFPTVSGTSNIQLIDYCERKLSTLGADSFKTFDDKKLRVNLFSTINGTQKLNGGGIILSGHTDVVPASGKDWTSNPFVASNRNNKLYGRDHFNEEIGARCLRFNHNGQVLVSAGENGAITLRHSSGQKLGQLIDKSASSNSLSSSLSNNNDENMYGNNTSMQQQQQQQHSNTIMPQINAVSFSSGSRYLACGGTDRIVKVWDLKKRSIIRNFKNHTSAVTCVEFSRDGDKYIGSGSSNGEIVLYNVVTGKLALTLSLSKNHNDMSLHDSFSNSSNRSTSTTSLSFSNLDRRLLASSSSDGMVCIWDITETETRALREGYGGLHSAPTSEVTFSPISPSIFASVGYDKRLLLVDHEGGGNVITCTFSELLKLL